MPDINIGRFRGGLCVYWYENGDRRRYQLEARSRKEAEAEAVEVYKKKTFESRPKNATCAEIWESYRKSLEDKPTGKTMKYTGKAILPHFGAWLPENLTEKLCKDYRDTRFEAGISQGSVWTELGHLQSALNYGLGSDAPKLWRPSKPESEKRILNAGEARALIDAAYAPHVKLALILLLGTGARVGALLELTWDRVDFDGNSINLRTEGSATRKGRAIVPMNRGVRAALSTAHEAALSDYVIEYSGGPVKKIRKGFSGAVERSKIGHVTIHELRHTAAVTMLAAGVPIEMVGQVLGHSNLATTYRIYARYLPGHMQSAVDSVDFTAIKSTY